jgi:hypothetical protein
MVCQVMVEALEALGSGGHQPVDRIVRVLCEVWTFTSYGDGVGVCAAGERNRASSLPGIMARRRWSISKRSGSSWEVRVGRRMRRGDAPELGLFMKKCG